MPASNAISEIARPGKRWILFLSIWGSVIGFGLHTLYSYETRPSYYETGPSAWPLDSRIQRISDRYQVVMFVHPRCPCSAASLSELERIVARARDAATFEILFFEPISAEEDWIRSRLVDRANSIPGVRVSSDPGGIEAQRFGAVASGHVIMFGPDGNRVFGGGITPSRGHEGSNEGRNALVDMLVRESAKRNSKSISTPTYGCILSNAPDNS